MCQLLGDFLGSFQRMTYRNKFSRLDTINVPIGRVARFSNCPRIRHAISTPNAYSQPSNPNRVRAYSLGISFFTHLHRPFRLNLETLSIDHSRLRLFCTDFLPFQFFRGKCDIRKFRPLINNYCYRITVLLNFFFPLRVKKG